MYCYGRDKIRALMSPAHIGSHLSKQFIRQNPLFTHLGVSGATEAVLDIIERWTRKNRKPPYNISKIQLDGRTQKVIKSVEMEKSFCTLLKFEIVGDRRNKPSILVVAPMSGHYATLVRDTVHTLLQDHHVYVTDWTSGYNVSVSEGEFCLDTYVDYLMDFYKHLGRDTHALAVCQPCVPVLMAAALLAKQKATYQPKSMILMGGPIDTRVNPTEVNKMTQNFSLEWFEKYMVSEIPSYAPGAGRKVTPGNLILAGFMSMNLGAHIQKHQQYVWDAARGRTQKMKVHQSFYDEYLSVMDLPAEYFIQTVDKVFQRHLLPRGEMDYRGEMLDFSQIKDTALMTIEGENDDIAAVGQTYSAHKICSGIPESMRKHFLRLDVGHYGIFSGRRWREDIYPQIRDFVAYHGSRED